MAFEENKAAKKANIRKRKIDDIKKVDFLKLKIGLFNKVTELSILCKAKIALIITSPNKELYVCGYPNYDAVIQQFLTGKDTMEEDSENKKQEEIVETLRLEYETIENKLMELKEKEKNFQAINDEVEKSGSVFPFWWNNSIDDMNLESLQEFKTSLENLKHNLSSSKEEKELILRSNLSY